jgi:putative CRISPR-associated protein (TIGR02619 family)
LKTSPVLLFVTCGTSALTNLVGENDSPEATALGAAISKYLSPACRDKESYATRHFLLERVVAAHTATLRCPHWANDPLFNRRTPAELISTFSLAKDLSEEEEKESAAELVLIASDTPEGELAASVNSLLLAKEPLSDLVPKPITKKISGWDNRFVNITPKLDLIVTETKQLLETRLRKSFFVYFNITGGFKGAIPSITALAMMQGWHLYYQHETLQGSTYFLLDKDRLIQMVEPKDTGGLRHGS